MPCNEAMRCFEGDWLEEMEEEEEEEEEEKIGSSSGDEKF
jgi:hypothetical protein